MARRKTNVIDVTPREVARRDPPPPPELPGEHEEEYFEDADVAARLVELAGDQAEAKIKVYKCEKSKRDAWCFDCAPAEFSEAFLRDEYGPGTYRIRMYGNTSTGYGLLTNRLLEIAPPARRSLLPSSQGSAAAPGAGGDVLIAAIRDSANAQLAGLAQLVQAMTTAQSNRGAMLAELKMMAEIFRPSGGTPAVAAPDPLSQFETFARLMKTVGGGAPVGDDPEAAPYNLMGKGLDAFMEFIRMNREGGAAPRAALPAASAVPAAVAAPAMSQPEEAEQVKILMRAKLAPLLMAATSGQDAEQWAEIVYNTADDEAIEMLALENWHELLCEIEPKFKDHRAWLDKVRAFVLQWAKEDAEADHAAANGLEPNPAANLTGAVEPGTSPGNAALSGPVVPPRT